MTENGTPQKLRPQTARLACRLLEPLMDSGVVTAGELSIIRKNLTALSKTGELAPVIRPKLITPQEAAEMLSISYSQYRALEKEGAFPFRRRMIGGKTVVQELKIELWDIRLAQMDPVDLRGVPAVEDGQTKWATPSFFPTDPESAGIIFLDELSAADPSIQVAAYQLLLDRRIGEYVVPAKWIIVAAGNRAEDNAVSLPMSSALANRMLHLELQADPEEWARWASEHGLDPSLIGFIRFRPEMLFAPGENCERGWPSPRSWAGVSRILEIGLDDDELPPCIVGLVGDEAAAQFLAYRKHFMALGDVRTMMLDPGKSLKLDSRKPDVCYALASALAYWVGRGETPAEKEKLLDGFFRLSLLLPSTFAVVAMIDALESDKDGALAERMTAHPEFPAWQKRFGNELEKRR